MKLKEIVIPIEIDDFEFINDFEEEEKTSIIPRHELALLRVQCMEMKKEETLLTFNLDNDII